MTHPPPDPAGDGPLAPLRRTPERFDLFAALRQVEAAFPNRSRLGEGRRSRDEPARLCQPPFMAFPPAQLAEAEARADGRLRIAQYVFGLFGPQGPLPLHVTVRALQRARQAHDPTLAHFADIFHHRLIALFYRAWARSQPGVERDRPATDRFVQRLAALGGTPGPAFARRAPLPDPFAWHVTGLLAQQTRPPELLERLIALLFQVPVRIQEFVGGWLDVPAADTARLDTGPRLGAATVGPRVYARHHRFRIVLGPLRRAAFDSFLPTGGRLPLLRALVRRSVGLALEWDLLLLLDHAEVPALRLDDGARLNWTSWLAIADRRDDAADVTFPGDPG
jgi:type VI secretion system protein ImpH